MLIHCSTNGAEAYSFWSKYGVVFRILCKTLKAIYVTG